MLNRLVAPVALILCMLAGSAGAAEMQTVVFQGLDKVTARISTFEAPVGEPVRFGTLQILVRTCEQSEPHELPENAVFTEVRERNQRTDEEELLFSGWMFSSNPALSALDHPVYDVWVKDCK